ncbi:MAG TPA: tannase/feruloyl esterase family alpha/beta hydrolase [Terriglobia bacterium]|nr:tannase/feruloyl esterase family alpha/beta hydrolase [Terriglobia bacterium]
MTFHRRSMIGVVAVVFLGIAFITDTATAALQTCESLAQLALHNGTVTSAQVVAAGAFVPPGGNARGGNAYANLPSFCRVTATLTPSSDSDIKIELWLPAIGWNGKFEAVGNGGWAGTIPYTAIASGLSSGYATAGTDTGHTGNNGDFALGHPEKLIDLGYRSIHEMTVQSKLLINAHYGTPAKYAYYNGCSQGGRQGLAAAQRYPEDFNGIVAGASAWNQMRMHAARTALNMAVNKDADSVIPRTKYAMINNAVLKACDGLDGVKDGVIENPAKCAFNYSVLMCRGADGADCLTKGQVESAKAMTSPITDPKTGKNLFAGHLMPGSELGWATLGGPQPLNLSISGMQNVVFQDRAWDYHKMNVSTDIELAAQADGGATYTGDPNLKPFFDRGGKLLMYHGWSDPQVNPLNSVMYYDNVVKTVGKNKAANSIALFMIPGMNHCQGGPGTDTFDKVAVLEKWVEQKQTPERIVASHATNGKIDRTRPLCSYGQVAKYNGSGDTNDAANFACGADGKK